MRITSGAFEHNQTIPAKYACDGEDINPALSFSDIPPQTKSLALIVDDPDAPAGVWIHWALYNINPETEMIAENSLPPGAIEVETSFGKPGYGGPCPPSGLHRYFFKVFALDATLLDAVIDDAEDLQTAMEDHIIAQAELIGLYQRP